MLDRLRDRPAAALNLDTYLADYRREYGGGGVTWKLERIQTLSKPGDPSWEAFAAGDWSRALELTEAARPRADAMVAKCAEDGVVTRHIRVVEDPVSPYLQWEMQFLRMLAEAGRPLRVVTAAQVAHWEHERMLPEIVVLGDRVLYLVRYDSAGKPFGAWRIGDRDVIARSSVELDALFRSGEPLLEYFHREIADLPPPAVRT
ncbi:hypothetical protein HNR12_003883 [Streptomonospora nanhaiensis]|uniref:DUF6879 domain-containing protein n=1 Tax=Streptomonospora nanhaiensis TaxID=1323731 RepID=A0A853BSB4_9ACTN|nr:DUF6879 family protein [Streptomonospora nanhaiensis]NYI97606.1 hypothetical protein [Streptomonospora nanhaiensis]